MPIFMLLLRGKMWQDQYLNMYTIQFFVTFPFLHGQISQLKSAKNYIHLQYVCFSLAWQLLDSCRCLARILVWVLHPHSPQDFGYTEDTHQHQWGMQDQNLNMFFGWPPTVSKVFWLVPRRHFYMLTLQNDSQVHCPYVYEVRLVMFAWPVLSKTTSSGEKVDFRYHSKSCEALTGLVFHSSNVSFAKEGNLNFFHFYICQ